MSFYREVIDIVNEHEVIDTRKNISRLVEEIKNFQHKIKNYVEDNYTDFLPNLSNNKIFLDDGERLFGAVENLMQNIANETKHDLVAVSDDLQNYIEELETVALGLRTSNKILKIDELFQLIDTAKTNHEYLKVMEHVAEIKELIYDPNDVILMHLDCFENIKIRYHVEHESMLHSLKQRFESLVQLNEKMFQKTKSVTMKITRDQKQLREIILALVNSKYNARYMCDFLVNNIFEPIITKPVSIDYTEENIDVVSLTLSYSLQPLVDDLRPNYKIVFNHITIAIQCLSYMNINISEDVCLFTIFAENIKETFLDLLLNNCLSHSIPNTMDEMNESTMVQDLLEFDKFLCKLKFLNESRDMQLKQFADKIEILFKNRFCMNIVDSAVEIMQKDLHDMVLVAAEDSNISSSCFPRCMVSKSTMVRM